MSTQNQSETIGSDRTYTISQRSRCQETLVIRGNLHRPIRKNIPTIEIFIDIFNYYCQGLLLRYSIIVYHDR